MTPHINAKKGEIAKIVLMPGDPLRAKYIAETFLTNPKLVNTVRNMFMYTGEYKGKIISVCGSGMGQPSIGIYSYELFAFYDVEKIIRIGSAGAYTKELNLYDVVLADSAYVDSTSLSQIMFKDDNHVFYPSQELNEQIESVAQKLNIPIHKGRVHSSDIFYNDRSLEETIKVSESICVEMESGMLFAVAKKLNKQAACILTISDNLITKEETSSSERETAFKKMMELALELN